MPCSGCELPGCRALGLSSSNPGYLKQWSVYSRQFLIWTEILHLSINLSFPLYFLFLPLFPSFLLSICPSVIFHSSLQLPDPSHSSNYWHLCSQPPDPVPGGDVFRGGKRWPRSLVWPWARRAWLRAVSPALTPRAGAPGPRAATCQVQFIYSLKPGSALACFPNIRSSLKVGDHGHYQIHWSVWHRG